MNELGSVYTFIFIIFTIVIAAFSLFMSIYILCSMIDFAMTLILGSNRNLTDRYIARLKLVRNIGSVKPNKK